MADSKCFKVILTLILMASQAAGLQSSLRENSTATDRGLSQGSPTRSLQVIDCEAGSYFEKAGPSCKACHPTCKTCAGPAIADCLQCSENRTIAENSSQKTLAYSESKRDIPIMGNCACSPNFKEGSNFTCEKSYIQNKDDALIVALSFFVTFLLSLIVVKLFQKKSREQSLLISRMEGSILKPQKEALNQEDTKDTLKTRDGRLDNRIFETERAILTTER